MPIFLPEEAEMLTTAWDPNLDTSSHEHTETLYDRTLFPQAFPTPTHNKFSIRLHISHSSLGPGQGSHLHVTLLSKNQFTIGAQSSKAERRISDGVATTIRHPLWLRPRRR